MEDAPTTLWTLVRGEERVACQVRLVPYGIEVDLVVSGRVVLTRTFDTDAEALAWADGKRTAREALGWSAAPPDDTSPPPRA